MHGDAGGRLSSRVRVDGGGPELGTPLDTCPGVQAEQEPNKKGQEAF